MTLKWLKVYVQIEQNSFKNDINHDTKNNQSESLFSK